MSLMSSIPPKYQGTSFQQRKKQRSLRRQNISIVGVTSSLKHASLLSAYLQVPKKFNKL
jgi:hypothetical protein